MIGKIVSVILLPGAVPKPKMPRSDRSPYRSLLAMSSAASVVTKGAVA